MTIIAVLVTAPAVVLFLPVLFLCVEICAGVLSGPALSLSLAAQANARRNRRTGVILSRPKIAVIVPAHNESAGLLPTLADLRGQLRPGDRLIVVADNCSDDTGAIAASAGAEVVARHDPSRVGKGYALARGLDQLRSSPPDIVIMVDADCRVAPDSLDELAETCSATCRPAQALYLMRAPEGGLPVSRLAEFAWRVKNWVRPLGLAAMHLPCQLAGSGMAFPWNLIASADLASGEIVEDLKLGLDMAQAGTAAAFCPTAMITSEFARSVAGARAQRVRWEQGHLAFAARKVPLFLYLSLAKADFRLFLVTIDLATPPMSLLAIMIVGELCIGEGVHLLFQNSMLIVFGTLSILLISLSLGLAWIKFGLDLISIGEVFRVPWYIFRKLPIYFTFLWNGSVQRWSRTERTRR